MNKNNRPGLQPREKNNYSTFISYIQRNPEILGLAAIIISLVFSAAFIYMSIEAAHIAGVTSYGG